MRVRRRERKSGALDFAYKVGGCLRAQAVWTHAGGQFGSRTQHDAQEFLAFLLNRLSEELSEEVISADAAADAAAATLRQKVSSEAVGGGGLG